MVKNRKTETSKKVEGSKLTTTARSASSSKKTKKRAREPESEKKENSATVEQDTLAPKRQCTMDSNIGNRRQKFHEKSDWRPTDGQMFPTPLKDGPDAENDDVIVLGKPLTSPRCLRSKRPGALQEINSDETSHYQFRNIFTPCSVLRPSPLPTLSWADSDELWKSMVCKEPAYERHSTYMDKHADLQPRMRSILLDWIMEVCEVYALHRETFYLAVDYIDRYLTNTKNIHKTRLQLVGVTALFIAAKLEEIYPPKLSDFAYVTDGACTEEEILSQELLMLSTLKWSLSPITAIAWLNVYLQTAHTAFSPNPNPSTAFFLPQYPQETFVHIAQLLDLCILDIESLDFNPGVIAASALYHFSSRELATQVSGYQFQDIAPCVHWLAPFAITVRDTGLQPLKQFKRVADSDAHNIQMHVNNIDILDAAFENRNQVQTQLAMCQSPTEIGGFMTPPKSGQKNDPHQERMCKQLKRPLNRNIKTRHLLTLGVARGLHTRRGTLNDVMAPLVIVHCDVIDEKPRALPLRKSMLRQCNTDGEIVEKDFYCDVHARHNFFITSRLLAQRLQCLFMS
uniref:G1/S-specific cyclin-E1 n=1 Tax=Phallusia mammillata TaxID=59560 RepID=A0A6F9D858_9ASCI|nr:G1/S-specific cyclin-E1 [Phallusia mammillata]